MISLLFFFCFYRRAIGENPVANSVNRRNGADAVRSSGSIRGTTALFVVFLCFSLFFFKVFFFLQILCVPFFFSSSSLAPRGFPAEWGTRRTEIKKPSNWPIVLRRRRRLSLPRFTEFLPSFPVSLGHRCAFTRMNECST